MRGMGPLTGVKVVELAGIGPAPFAAMLLAELGADVIRVDRPGGGLMLGPPELELVNRGRRSVALDLKHPDAVDVVRRLAAQADVLVEGFRPGVAERLGLGPEDCHALNPRLVYGRMTGWGQDGPLASVRRARHRLPRAVRSAARHPAGRADRRRSRRTCSATSVVARCTWSSACSPRWSRPGRAGAARSSTRRSWTVRHT